MKQFRITTDNLSKDSPDDCYLAPTDPIHELKASALFDGLGAEQRIQEYKAKVAQLNKVTKTGMSGTEKSAYMKEHNIKPGTDAWFKLWFSNPNITGEQPT